MSGKDSDLNSNNIKPVHTNKVGGGGRLKQKPGGWFLYFGFGI